MKRLFVALLAMTLACALYAQEFRGVIVGVITDPSGAAVVSAKIVVTEVSTRVTAQAASDASGNFNVPFLLPGDYEVQVTAAGFRDYVRKGIHLGAGERPSLPIRLDIGEARQTVEVVADAPLINQENASVGEAITTREIEDLPSNGGTPMALAFMAPGVVMTGQPSQILPFASGNAAAFSMGGMPQQQNELLVDGVPNTTWDGRLAYSAPREAVAEVRTKVFDTDATYGRTSGGTANTILKSGSNTLHGSVAYYNQPNNLVANDFFRNKAGQKPTVTHYNQGGLSVSGPLYLPKIFDGRNKVFWMFAFEDIQSSSPNTTFVSVPTAAERGGDFSKLLAVNGATMYDPATAVAAGSGYTRTAFPGNRIPASRLNPIALKYLQWMPEANITSSAIVRADDYQNFINNTPTRDGFTNELGRLDFNLGARSRSYFNVRHTDYFQTKNNYFSNLTTGSNLSRSNWGGSFDEVFLLNAANVLNFRVNFTRMFEDHSAPSAGFNPTSIGYPSYMAQNSQYLQLPMVSFSNSTTGFTSMGMNGANTLPSQSFQLFASWVATRGAHNLKVGFDGRQYRLNYFTAGNATGQFSFSGNSWVRASNSASSTVAMGQDFASFLLGLPYTSSGSVYDINASAMFYQYYLGVFAQDDWKVSRTLTVNLGVRFDRDFPYHEKWGRTVNGFAFGADSPLSAAARAAYAATPSALLPASQFNVQGGLTFASPGDNRIFRNSSHLVSPRIGLAWSPEALHGKTVIRSGFGMFVAPTTIAQLNPSGSYSTNPLLTQQGFSQQTAMAPTNDNYVSSAADLSNPYPNGLKQPAGSSSGLLTYAGQAISFFNPEMQSPYTLRWNFSVQHQVSPSTMVEFLYLGSHSVHLPMTYTQLNGVPLRFLSTKGTRDAEVNSAMSASIANPFYGLGTATTASKTVSVAQVLAQYPQFPVYTSAVVTSGASSVVEYNVNRGASFFQGANIRINRKLSSDLNLSASFMKSRIMDQTAWRNAQDSVPDYRISPIDHSHVIKVMASYRLPVGRGKRLNTTRRWMTLALGDWRMAGTYTFQTGAPIVWSNSDYVYFGGNLNLQPREVGKAAFDTTRFDVSNSNQFAYHLRTFSSTFSNLRQDGINQMDVSLLKDFRFGEGNRILTLKCDAFNALNHPTFAAPNVTPTNSAFGTITAMANKWRTLQLGARIVF